MSYWLLKSEPSVFSFDDLLVAPGRTTRWDGIRNYQARNFMRDGFQVGDRVLFYHSSTDPQAVVGIAEVVRAAYPDASALDPKSLQHDPRSTVAEPIWLAVDIRAVERFAEPVTLARLRTTPGLEEMALLRKGSRLSVQPVRAEEWDIVCRLGARARA